jgi:hypothetical protein
MFIQFKLKITKIINTIDNISDENSFLNFVEEYKGETSPQYTFAILKSLIILSNKLLIKNNNKVHSSDLYHKVIFFAERNYIYANKYLIHKYQPPIKIN